MGHRDLNVLLLLEPFVVCRAANLFTISQQEEFAISLTTVNVDQKLLVVPRINLSQLQSDCHLEMGVQVSLEYSRCTHAENTVTSDQLIIAAFCYQIAAALAIELPFLQLLLINILFHANCVNGLCEVSHSLINKIGVEVEISNSP